MNSNNSSTLSGYSYSVDGNFITLNAKSVHFGDNSCNNKTVISNSSIRLGCGVDTRTQDSGLLSVGNDELIIDGIASSNNIKNIKLNDNVIISGELIPNKLKFPDHIGHPITSIDMNELYDILYNRQKGTLLVTTINTKGKFTKPITINFAKPFRNIPHVDIKNLNLDNNISIYIGNITNKSFDISFKSNSINRVNMEWTAELLLPTTNTNIVIGGKNGYKLNI